MLHLFLGNSPWFAAKRYGYGAGLPIRWQGWTLLVSYLMIVPGIGLLYANSHGNVRVTAAALFIFVTILFVFIVYRHTEGGWKWRWDGK